MRALTCGCAHRDKLGSQLVDFFLKKIDLLRNRTPFIGLKATLIAYLESGDQV